MSKENNNFKKSPFGDGANWHLNACVGNNGGPHNYTAYARGYFESGNLIAEHLIEANRKFEQSRITIDCVIYPLLYLYRQGCELMLKHFIYKGENSSKNNGSHDLQELWQKAEKRVSGLAFFGYGTEEGANIVSSIREFIFMLYELDPRGEASRFPEDLGRNGFFKEYSIINIEPIYRAGIKALENFEGVVCIEDDEDAPVFP